MWSRDNLMHEHIGRAAMTIYKYAVIGAAIAGVAVAGLVVSGAHAEKKAAFDVYKPAQGVIETFGSKHAVGYFAQKDGACAMTLFIAETNDEGNRVPTASRLRVNVKPGDKTELGAVEGQSLEITCGTDAASIEISHGTFKAAYLTQ
jgi:hypothetical protein